MAKITDFKKWLETEIKVNVAHAKESIEAGQPFYIACDFYEKAAMYTKILETVTSTNKKKTK